MMNLLKGLMEIIYLVLMRWRCKLKIWTLKTKIWALKVRVRILEIKLWIKILMIRMKFWDLN